MDDPDAVEMDKELEERALFVIGLEEGAVPIDFIESHEALGRRDVHEAGLDGRRRVND